MSQFILFVVLLPVFFYIPMVPKHCFPLFFILAISLSALHAQQPAWRGAQLAEKKIKEKSGSTAAKLKSWKDDIKQWGLDTNFNHSFAAEGRLNTNGWSAGFWFSKQIKRGQAALWQLRFSEIKDEKETVLKNPGSFPGLDKPGTFIFGKVNRAYSLQLGYGRSQILLPAVLNGDLSISLYYSGGLSMALLKPYYLDLIYIANTPNEPTATRTEKYRPENADKFLTPGYIWRSARWAKGLDEIKPVPGIFGELAFSIEPDRPEAFVKAITFGVNAAFYAQPLTIMAERRAYRWQASLMAGISLGKRWK